MAKVLVVGGAGYVGSASCAYLLDQGHDLVVLDDLSTGYRKLALGQHFYEGQAGDRSLVEKILRDHQIECVMHFAAKSLVGESVKKPQEYFDNNVVQTQTLLDAIQAAGVDKFIFSSTCAIFGDPGDRALDEHHPTNPLSPYGETKLEVEGILAARAAQGLKSIALRYFNAAGADAQMRVGECHEPETHLIPRILKSVRAGFPVQIFGTDYPTQDGTCVRDYIHVSDLAQAHEAAMRRLLEQNVSVGKFEAFNLGSENGYSVREIIAACEKAVGRSIEVVIQGRRAGDPPRLIAQAGLAKKQLGFKATHGLDSIVESAWLWEKKNSATLRKAVFLDRDGTINDDPGYLSDPAQIRIFPYVAESLAKLKQAGFLLIVVSNQSGVERGLIKESELTAIHAEFNRKLGSASMIDYFELCIHHPDSNCDCRKPKPKLIQDAARKYSIDLSRSFMVGDKISDVGAGRASQVQATVLVRTGSGVESEAYLKKGEASFTADSLREAADWILKKSATSQP